LMLLVSSLRVSIMHRPNHAINAIRQDNKTPMVKAKRLVPIML
jgi:hypothetical protein